MKKLMLALALVCATVLAVQAQDAPKKHKMTAEQKQVMTDMLAKYDTNKDGKLDKSEKAAMSQEDKDLWAKTFPPHKKKSADAPAADAPATDAPAAPAADAGK